MAVTDLTGYTWYAKGNGLIELEPNLDGWIAIDFISNGNDFKYFLPINGGWDATSEVTLTYGNIAPYIIAYDYDSGSGWIDEAYRTVLFTGGGDVTNTQLISILEANGTLTPPTPPPSNIAEKLLAINQIKQDIKSAIENKDVDMTGVDFGGYAGKIDMLPAVVELTQAQYDAIIVYDVNTYYLIVEE